MSDDRFRNDWLNLATEIKKTNPGRKTRIAMYCGSGCGGCETSIIDMGWTLAELSNAFDIVFWPLIRDLRYSRLEDLNDKSIDLCLFSGAVRTEEEQKIARLLRKKSKLLASFGTCAYLGGITGIANMTSPDRLLETKYRGLPSLAASTYKIPQDGAEVSEGVLKLPHMLDKVILLTDVVDVDYVIPGCPTPPHMVSAFLTDLLQDRLPPLGSILSGGKTLCDECPRERKGDRVKTFQRIHDIQIDPEKCILDQGVHCMGPVTRSGCNASCVSVNMPCRGCFGPAEGMLDQGACYVSLAGPLLEGNAEHAGRGLADISGLAYRFSLPSSILKKKVKK